MKMFTNPLDIISFIDLICFSTDFLEGPLLYSVEYIQLVFYDCV